MFPQFTANNLSNVTISCRKYFCKFSASTSFRGHLSDFDNLVISQLSFSAFLAPGICAMFAFIKVIIGCCVPSQIIKSAVMADTIAMTGFHTWRTWPNKSKQYKTMDINGVSFAISTKRDCQISSRYSWFNNSLRCLCVFPCTFPLSAFSLEVRPDSPPVAYFVPRESRNRFPFFKGDVKLFCSHGMNLLQRLRLWLEPLSCSCRAAACLFIAQ